MAAEWDRIAKGDIPKQVDSMPEQVSAVVAAGWRAHQPLDKKRKSSFSNESLQPQTI
jgi:hypothetical protein